MRPLLVVMRLDLYLVMHGMVTSRTEAKNFITEGAVTVNSKVVKKPAFDVPEEGASVAVDTSSKRFASRGGLKLEAALEKFGVSVEGRYAIDIGASSGGFTDCLLKRGAKHVIAVDSGHSQLVKCLSSDERVTSLENYNARYLSSEDLEYAPDIAVMDVSFISATYIIPKVYSVLAAGGDFICLIKPQFEVGRSNIGKNGVVTDEKCRKMAVEKVIFSAESVGFSFVSHIKSPILGGDGNVEYLAHFKK